MTFCRRGAVLRGTSPKAPMIALYVNFCFTLSWGQAGLRSSCHSGGLTVTMVF
jgi:hypothetical protein